MPCPSWSRVSSSRNFLLCVVPFYLLLNWFCSLNCQKTFYGGDSLFFSWWTNWVSEGPAECWSWCGHPACCSSSASFSFDFITLRQFDLISSPFYSPAISNQWRILCFLWLLFSVFRRIPGTSRWRFKCSGASCQWLVLWLVPGSAG